MANDGVFNQLSKCPVGTNSLKLCPLPQQGYTGHLLRARVPTQLSTNICSENILSGNLWGVTSSFLPFFSFPSLPFPFFSFPFLSSLFSFLPSFPPSFFLSLFVLFYNNGRAGKVSLLKIEALEDKKSQRQLLKRQSKGKQKETAIVGGKETVLELSLHRKENCV